MKTICLYFQVHQPWRLKTYRFFNMGVDHNYLDDLSNRAILQKVARQCYLPMNALLLKLIKEQKGRFRCSFSLTGTVVEQFRAYAPEVLESFRELAETGCVEFLAETYSHSLASLASQEDFEEQVKLHTAMVRKEFGMKPTAFRNTEIIYSDHIGEMVAQMGFKTILAENQLVRVNGKCFGSVSGAAACQYGNQIVYTEGIQGSEQQGYQNTGLHERQGDCSKCLHRRSAVDGGTLIQTGIDGLQAGHEKQRHVGRGLPDICQDRRCHSALCSQKHICLASDNSHYRKDL